jgi:hypothetical protein
VWLAPLIHLYPAGQAPAVTVFAVISDKMIASVQQNLSSGHTTHPGLTELLGSKYFPYWHIWGTITPDKLQSEPFVHVVTADNAIVEHCEPASQIIQDDELVEG